MNEICSVTFDRQIKIGIRCRLERRHNGIANLGGRLVRDDRDGAIRASYQTIGIELKCHIERAIRNLECLAIGNARGGRTCGWHFKCQCLRHIELKATIEFQYGLRTIAGVHGNAGTVQDGCTAGWINAQGRLVDQRHFINAVAPPEASQRCQANGTAVGTKTKNVVDTLHQRSAVLGQDQRIRRDRVWVRPRSGPFI